MIGLLLSPIFDLVTVYFINARINLDYYQKSETEQSLQVSINLSDGPIFGSSHNFF